MITLHNYKYIISTFLANVSTQTHLIFIKKVTINGVLHVLSKESSTLSAKSVGNPCFIASYAYCCHRLFT